MSRYKNLLYSTQVIDTFYNTNICLLDLTNGRLPAVHMDTNYLLCHMQFPCCTSIVRISFKKVVLRNKKIFMSGHASIVTILISESLNDCINFIRLQNVSFDGCVSFT